jgi:predicted membrane protein
MKLEGARLAGWILLILGGIFLLDNLFDSGLWGFIWKFWPLTLVVLGVYIIMHRDRIGKGHSINVTESNRKFIGDSYINYHNDEVGHRSASLLIGDLRIDLTGARLVSGENSIHASIAFGEVKITIPSNFPVKISSQCVVGDIKFNDNKEDGIFPKMEHTDNDYESAESKLFISLSGVIGDLSVEKT